MIVTTGSFELMSMLPMNHSMKEPEGELRTSQVKLTLSPAVTILFVGLVMNTGSTEDTEMNSNKVPFYTNQINPENSAHFQSVLMCVDTCYLDSIQPTLFL